MVTIFLMLLLSILLIAMLILAGIAIMFASPLVFVCLIGMIIDGAVLGSIVSKHNHKQKKGEKKK